MFDKVGASDKIGFVLNGKPITPVEPVAKVGDNVSDFRVCGNCTTVRRCFARRTCTSDRPTPSGGVDVLV